MASSELSVRILAEIKRDPNRRGQDIAEICGCAESTVYNVAKGAGVFYGTRARRKDPLEIAFSPDNARFIRDQSIALGLKPMEFVDSCITDARLDEGEI